MYSATVTVSTPKAGDLAKVFAAEDKELGNQRGTYTLECFDNKLVIHAHADDAVAFRAVVSAISKVLAIHQKITRV